MIADARGRYIEFAKPTADKMIAAARIVGFMVHSSSAVHVLMIPAGSAGGLRQGREAIYGSSVSLCQACRLWRQRR